MIVYEQFKWFFEKYLSISLSLWWNEGNLIVFSGLNSGLIVGFMQAQVHVVIKAKAGHAKH